MKSNEVDSARRKIDEIDQEIVRLISERTEIVKSIGDLKRAAGQPTFRPDRHMSVYQKVSAGNPGLRNVYREVMSMGMSVEGDMRIFVLRSSDLLAARAIFGSSVGLAVQTFAEMEKQIQSSKDSYGILCVDELTAEDASFLVRSDLRVYGEAMVAVSKTGDRLTYWILSGSQCHLTGKDKTIVGGFADQGLGAIQGIPASAIRIRDTDPILFQIDGHIEDAAVKQMTDQLLTKYSGLKVIGSFPAAVGFDSI